MCVSLTWISTKADNKCGMYRQKLIFVPTKNHEIHCADFHETHSQPIYGYRHLIYSILGKTENIESTGKIWCMPLNKVQLSLHQFSRKSQMLNKVTWKSAVPNCTHICKEICEVWVEIHLYLSVALGRSLNRFPHRPRLLYTLFWRTFVLIFMKIWQTKLLILGLWWTDDTVSA